uniref:Two-component response regulator n=1 Tax=Ananas comosus var. bracteatus TaxID=296719 RepID=A0A6V7P4C6_ANACO|nr:unnamed protein product [Ananas comosus var. bracteatus]
MRDHFPVGMRVLAVDDDPTCLKLLEVLLLRCKYHGPTPPPPPLSSCSDLSRFSKLAAAVVLIVFLVVCCSCRLPVTTTNQAITALKLLRENKDKFDLVISDVHMPDMDGFKLLELVGLEMDLPVIMLSANGETKAVMKGITHGACDYLLKPVRIEELKNIWQHVVRRRKLDRVDADDDYERLQGANCALGHCQVSDGSAELAGRSTRKRKDQIDEDDDDNNIDCENDNAQENEDQDPASQKKARVVWSVELHRKFVAAVNQLGIDKAVPKKILDLMNVEKLTRENVASHLQKYSNYQSLAPASAHLPALTSFQPSGLLNRTNPARLGLPGLSPAGIVQVGCIQNNAISNPIDNLGNLSKFQCITENQHGNLLQGVPSTLELDQLQQSKRVQEANNGFPNGFSGNGLASASCSTPFINTTNNPLLSQSQTQLFQSRGLGSHSSMGIPLINSESSQGTLRVASSNLSFNHDNLSNIGNNFSTVSHIENNPISISASSLLGGSPYDSMAGRNLQNDSCFLGGNMIHSHVTIDEKPKILNFGAAGSFKQKTEELKQGLKNEANQVFSAFAGSSQPTSHIIDPNPINRLEKSNINGNTDMGLFGQASISAPVLPPRYRIDNKPTTDGQLNFKDEFLLGSSRLQGGFTSNGCNFDDLVSSMIKPERDDLMFVDGDIGCDFYPLGACI